MILKERDFVVKLSRAGFVEQNVDWDAKPFEQNCHLSHNSSNETLKSEYIGKMSSA